MKSLLFFLCFSVFVFGAPAPITKNIKPIQAEDIIGRKELRWHGNCYYAYFDRSGFYACFEPDKYTGNASDGHVGTWKLCDNVLIVEEWRDIENGHRCPKPYVWSVRLRHADGVLKGFLDARATITVIIKNRRP